MSRSCLPICICIAVFLSASQAGADATPHKMSSNVLGVYLDLGAATIIVKELPDDHLKPSFSAGTGLFFDHYFTRNVGLSLGMGLIDKGFRDTSEDMTMTDDLLYLEFPVGPKFDFRGFQLGVALAPSIALTGSTYVEELDDSFTWDDEYWDINRRFNLAMKTTIGGRIPFNTRFSLMLGLTFTIHLLNEMKMDEYDDMPSNASARYLNIMFTTAALFSI